LRNPLVKNSEGSVESFITLIPQVFIFLLMFQLVFMQFSFIRDTHTSQGEISRTAILGGSKYTSHPLVGGGSVLLLDETSVIEKFIDFGSLAQKKIISIAVDENVNS
jgi:hypothetical protein